MADETGNTAEAQRKRRLEELLRLCAEHSWNNKDNDYRHRRQFQEIGIESSEQLHQVLEQAAKDKGTRSFERQPEPDRQQTEPSLILQAKIRDKQEREHQLTIVLNPDRDENGKTHGGTVYLNDPNRRPDIFRYLAIEQRRGFNPPFRLREDDLTRSDESVLKTPAHRVIGDDEGGQKLTDFLYKQWEEKRKDNERENSPQQNSERPETMIERNRRLREEARARMTPEERQREDDRREADRRQREELARQGRERGRTLS